MKKIKITEQQAKLLGLKPKNIIKITKEQYNRIFTTGIIKEDINPVDNTYKKVFANKDIQNLESVQTESDFDIKKRNASIPASAQGKFGKDMFENDNRNNNEVKELIAYLYRKTDQFPQSLVDKGLSFDEICDVLLSKNIIIDDNGKYLLSKSLGSPENAIKAVQDELDILTGGSLEEPTEDTIVEPIQEPELETEDAGGYPTGADTDPRAPWRGEDPVLPTNRKSSAPKYKVLAFNGEIAIVKGLKTGIKYLLDISDLNEPLSDIAQINTFLIRQPNLIQKGLLQPIDDSLRNELLQLHDKDKEIISALEDMNEGDDVMDKFKTNTKKAFTPDSSKTEKSPEELQKIKDKLADIRAKELERRKTQDGVDETTTAASSGSFTGPLNGPMFNREVPDEVNHLNVPVVKENQLGKGYTHFAIDKDSNKIVTGWDYKGVDKEDVKYYSTIDLKDEYPDKKLSSFKIVTRKFLENNAINPADVKNWQKIDDLSITETTSGSGSMGAYDANALPGIKRDGSFKETKPTKAQKNTQYAGGSFVEIGDCTKMNNKPAGSGCSQGAVDNVVKLKKTASNINAPSLGGKN